jgi:hypothetical protein
LEALSAQVKPVEILDTTLGSLAIAERASWI